MRKKNLWKICLAVGLVVITLSHPVYAANWVCNNIGWWYYEDNGSYPVNQWKKINGHWYWFDNDGYMVTGWKQISGIWYYFDLSGAMATDTWIGNYYVESSGAMAISKWIGNYYVNENGLWIKTSYPDQWIASGNRWWYRHADGSYTTNGWEKINGKEYFFDSDGWMLTGWQFINSKWYYLEKSGAKATSKWIGNYYVEENGVMATDKWIDGYYVNAFGLWVKTEEQHNWSQFTWERIKNGYACNYCCNDITEYEDLYGCHGGWHTHTFYQFPSYYICNTCNKLLHKHNWYYIKPEFKDGSNEITSKGYWKCWQCGNLSSDGVNTDTLLVSEAGYEYSSKDHWTTPYNFKKDNYEWIVEDGYWEPADDRLNLQYIRLQKTMYSMSIGDSYQNNVIFTPENPIEGKYVSWESSDPSVVSVDDKGIFTALQNGEAVITATSSYHTARCFVRVTNTNVGKVSSAILYINGQSNLTDVIRLKPGRYIMNVQTNPEQAVYEVRYKNEEQSTAEWISNITGAISCGSISTYGWEKGVDYTDSSTTIEFFRRGSVILKAIITDVNGNKIELSQKVIID